MWMFGNRKQWIPKEEIYSENFSGLKKGYIQFKVKFGNRKEFNSEKEQARAELCQAQFKLG